MIQNSEDFIEQNYIEPEILTADKKKNLVLIYVESLETTYSDSTLFKNNLLLSIDNLTSNAESFINFRQHYGTGWTMAALVSSQCGVPLKTSFGLWTNQIGENIKSFLPNIRCLGDVLKENGYKNIFMGGASLSFAGKGTFLLQHGYSEVFGKEEWIKSGSTNFNGWGLYDDELFELAKIKLSQLEKSNSPFNLTLLTIDLHHPYGFISETCKKRGVEKFEDIVECSSDKLAEFVKFMSDNNYLENTNLIIIGDHLAMSNPVKNTLAKSKDRYIYNKFLIQSDIKKNRVEIDHFSIFPTILYSLGFKFNKNRLGLGLSGFGEVDQDYTFHSLEPKIKDELLSGFSKKYIKFWETEK